MECKGVLSLWKKQDIMKGNTFRTYPLKFMNGIPIAQGISICLLFHESVIVGEKFLDQPSGSFGTAFYVQSRSGKHYAITAGHCVQNRDGKEIFYNWKENVRFVHGFYFDTPYNPNERKPFQIPIEAICEGTTDNGN